MAMGADEASLVEANDSLDSYSIAKALKGAIEKTGKKHSSIEFQELDKLLTIYEKQKLESIFIPKNTKEKLHKI